MEWIIVAGARRVLIRAVVDIHLCKRISGGDLLALRRGLFVNNVVFVLGAEVRHLLIHYAEGVKRRAGFFDGLADALRHRHFLRTDAHLEHDFRSLVHLTFVLYGLVENHTLRVGAVVFLLENKLKLMIGFVTLHLFAVPAHEVWHNNFVAAVAVAYFVYLA